MEETIRARLLKVLRLAQQGIGGEKENAEVLLGKLLRKHSLTMSDLEGTLDQPRTREWLPVGDKEETMVLSQLIVRLFGIERTVWHTTSGIELGIDLTPSERAALAIAWEVYRAAFADARKALVMGFCFKHGLYAQTGATTADMTPEARADAQRAIALADALPGVRAPGKRLGSGS